MVPVEAWDHIRSWLRRHTKRHQGRLCVLPAMPHVAALAKKTPTSWLVVRNRYLACVTLCDDEIRLLENADFDAHGYGKWRAFHPDRKECKFCAVIGHALLEARRPLTDRGRNAALDLAARLRFGQAWRRGRGAA